MKDKVPARFLALEGLRGLAASMVVIFHAILIFYPGVFYGIGSLSAPTQHSNIEVLLYGNPINVFASGQLAVAIFFVLSGFVLTVGFFKTGDTKIIKKLALKRYLRLMIPALVSILIVYAVVKFGLNYNKELVQQITQSGWLGMVWNFVPHISEALNQGFIGIFNGSAANYNPVLWTMQFEFLGSLMVFFIASVVYSTKYRWLLYGLLAVIFANSWYFGFILGMTLADAYVNKEAILRVIRPKAVYITLLFGLFVGGYPGGKTDGTLYAPLQLPFLTMDQNVSFYTTTGAILIVYSILMSPLLTKLLSSKIISRLGKYTFSIYLTHMPVLFTVGATTFLILNNYYAINVAALLSIIVTLPFVAIVAILFEKFVDSPAIQFSSYVASLYLGEKKIPRLASLFKRNHIVNVKKSVVPGGIFTENIKD